MDFIKWIFDFILHIDQHLVEITNNYGTITYAIMFLIIFAETGFVFTPLLPGDSLLFALGSITVLDNSQLSLPIFMILLTIAAILGDSVNYGIGKYFGKKLFSMRWKIIKEEYYEKTEQFYDKYGAKTIILARFVPIVRTFAPFVAGIGKMNYKKFLTFNVVGGLLWINSFLLLGALFANNEIVKENFTLVIFGIIFVSILPIVIEFIKHNLLKQKQK